MSKKVLDILPKTEILAQLAEEESVAECEANLMEEFADINNGVTALCDA